MGAAERKPNPALIEQLLREPGAFDFLRAVQVLEAQRAVPGGRRAPKPVGSDHPTAEVGVRFGAAASLAFPAKPIAAVRSESSAGDQAPIYEVLVSFFGLFGPAATLPTHYTETLLQRLHAKDHSLKDFLNAFQDRSLALFYRAWSKYRLPLAYGSTERSRGEIDPILSSILCLVGLAPRARGKALEIGELAEAHHAGFFSDRRRSASGLSALLGGLLRCQVRVEQFVGQWVELDADAWSRLGDGPGPGSPARLGNESVLGARVWSVDSRVRIVAGPLDRERFRRLWPGGAPVRFLWGLLRAYLGPLLQCDLVWELAPGAPVPQHLGGDQRLGRDSWLGWSGFGGPDTHVGSPPWHNSSPGQLRPDAIPSRAGLQASTA